MALIIKNLIFQRVEVFYILTKKKALSPNRVVPLDEEGCGKMAKAHTAPGFAGDAPFLSTQTGDRAKIIGLQN